MGFGKEKDKNYLGLECFIDRLGDEGGDLLTNKRIDSRDTITNSLTRMQVDPLDPPKCKVDIKQHTCTTKSTGGESLSKHHSFKIPSQRRISALW